MRIALFGLKNQHLFYHDAVWFGQAQFYLHKEHQNKKHQKADKKFIQSQAVRELLTKLLAYYHIHTQLNDSNHPYRLDDGKWVSFSHSKAYVAVVVSNEPVGIDIEKNPVSIKVVERFFCQDECDYLTTLPKHQSDACCKLLWQIKECLIKIEQISLIDGLKINVLDAILSANSQSDGLNHLVCKQPIKLEIKGYGSYHFYYHQLNDLPFNDLPFNDLPFNDLPFNDLVILLKPAS